MIFIILRSCFYNIACQDFWISLPSPFQNDATCMYGYPLINALERAPSAQIGRTLLMRACNPKAKQEVECISWRKWRSIRRKNSIWHLKSLLKYCCLQVWLQFLANKFSKLYLYFLNTKIWLQINRCSANYGRMMPQIVDSNFPYNFSNICAQAWKISYVDNNFWFWLYIEVYYWDMWTIKFRN